MRMSMLLSKECGIPKDQLKQLVLEIEEGMPIGLAAAIVGVSAGKVKKLVAMGEEGIEPFDELARAVAKAKALSVREYLQSVRLAAKDPRRYQAAIWLLERVAPEEFGAKQEQESTALEVEIIIGGDRGEVEDDGED